tara:strand:+ start:2768 stop:3460 length:693 start_codon:yes stop_codon:yes gene_type:complete
VIDYFSFSTEDATKYGVDGAILLHHLRYWVAKNEANDKNFHEGSHWTYNSTSAFAVLFPFWTARKIGRLLQKLEDDGIIISGNFNNKRYDRTKWFTISGNTICQKGEVHSSNMVNAITKYVEPIPDNNHTKTQNTTKVVLPFDCEEFLDAWNMWKDERKQKKINKYTPRGEQGALHLLHEQSGKDLQEAIAMINNAIARGWQSIHPRKNGKRNTNKQFNKDKYSDYLDTL